jgi:hypothetical protein
MRCARPITIALLAALTAARLTSVPADAKLFARASPKPTAPPTPRPEPCVTIPVELTDALDTARVHTGDTFTYRTIDTIVTSDGVTVPRNATGYGLIAFAQAAGAHGKSGYMIIEARYIDVARHRQFPVTIDSLATSALVNGRSGNAASGLGIVPLPFIGTAVGAFNYLHAGKNAVIEPGTRFTVVPVGNLQRRPTCSL